MKKQCLIVAILLRREREREEKEKPINQIQKVV